MIHWNTTLIKTLMVKKGLANGNQFREFTGLTIPTAYAVLSGEPVYRIDCTTLETLRKAFGLKSPWALLDYTPD